MTMHRRLLLATPFLATPAWAQSRAPIRILVGFAPGGAADISVRIAAEAVARRGGPQIIPETRSGAVGYLAMQAAARAVPDGATLATAIMGNMSVAPAVPGSQIPLDLERELTPVCNLTGTPMALIVPGGAPDRSVAELVARARAAPGTFSYASTGNGSTNQLAAEYFAAEAGLRLIHEMPLLTRNFPALDMSNWFGLVGPAGMPAELVTQIGRMFTEAMADPATQPALAARGLQPINEVGADFAARIRRDRERWARVANASGVRAD